MKPSILIIYTGGTIGMVQHPEDGSLIPVKFEQLTDIVPELSKYGFSLTTITFEPPIDSSNMNPNIWVSIATTIHQNYQKYDGFVVLHGTDTMAYTASALSFMFENLDKPVIFTGSQLPMCMVRTDGKENLITAIEIAAAMHEGRAAVPEVCIYFDNKLFRGNRTSKRNSQQFEAFGSENYPLLAKAGVEISYNFDVINSKANNGILKINTELSTNVLILKIFPGMNQGIIESILSNSELKGVVLESFGSGNIPTQQWFIRCIKGAIDRGVVFINITQCVGGKVQMGKYQTSIGLIEAGVISGFDMTTEAAITKLMYLLGQDLSNEEINHYLNRNLKGEITE